jgi:hypothetical protein
MGLAVYLEDESPITVENTCHCCGHVKTEQIHKQYLSLKITHNLASMANACGLYEALWKPDENGIEYAEQLIPILKLGFKFLCENEHDYRVYEPKNGWGTYIRLVSFVKEYLIACEKYPKSKIRVER